MGIEGTTDWPWALLGDHGDTMVMSLRSGGTFDLQCIMAAIARMHATLKLGTSDPWALAKHRVGKAVAQPQALLRQVK